MIEASLTLYNDSNYNTEFGTYPDYQNGFFDKMVRTSFFRNFYWAYFHLINKSFFPKESDIKNWTPLKDKIVVALQLNVELFTTEYQQFKFGLKLKALRNCSKKNFSKKTGLSFEKITQIEDFGFLPKINDVRIYIEKGLGKNFILDIK